MKINRFTLPAFLIIIIFTSFYSCKKDDSQIDSPPVTKYSQLPADVSKAAQWYDQQVIDRNSRNLTGKNTIDWSKVIKSTMPDGSTVYALQIYGAKNMTNELNINQSVDDQFYAVVKSYTIDNQTGIITLKFLDLDENIIEQGVSKENGKYTFKNQHIVNFSPPLKEQPVDLPSNNGGGDNTGGGGISIGVDGSGQTIVVITAPGSPSTPSDPGPVFSFPSNPSFPSDPGFPGGSGGGGSGGSGSNQSIITNQIKDPCLNNVVTKALNGDIKGEITGILRALGENTNINITIMDVASLSDGADDAIKGTFTGQDGVVKFELTISLNLSNLHSEQRTASQEFVAGTIIHEAIHAYFRSKTGSDEKVNEMDHQIMSTSYVAPMAEYLSGLYGLSNMDARSIVWRGLMKTDAYTNATVFDIGNSVTVAKQDLQDMGVQYSLGILGKKLCD